MSKPCKIQNVRMAAIYNVIKRLNEEQGINTIPGVYKWFVDTYGENNTVTEQEIIDSLVATSPKKIRGAVKDLEDVTTRIQEEKKLLQLIDKLVTDSKDSPADMASVDQMTKINDAVGRIFKAIDANKELSATEGVNARIDLGDIQALYQDLFNRNPEVAAAARQNIRRRLDALKSILRVDALDSRLKDLKSKIDNLRSEDIDVSNLVDPNTAIPTQYTAAVLEKEAELSEAKSEIEYFLNKRKIQEKAQAQGFFGFKSPRAKSIRVNAELALGESWEVMRTMKFMFDASAFGTQLAPIAIPDLVGINIDAIRAGDFANVFSSQKRLASVIWNQFWLVVKDDIDAAKRTGDLRRARGSLALRYSKEIMTDPIFGVAKRADLKISQGRSLSNTEEMFHATVLNRLKVFGLAKDISEDAMVAPLNAYRFSLFKEFYQANPGISDAELKKAAHFINELTGTSHHSAGAYKWAFSAPRLLFSRLSLAFIQPLKTAAAVDIAATVSNPLKGIQFQTAADQFIAKQMYRMWSGYAKMFTLIAAVGAIRSDVDWPEKWDEFKGELGSNLWPNFSSDWLRVKSGHVVYDFTGGTGALYRMLAKVIFLQNGPSENASFKEKEMYNYYTNVLKETPITVAVKTLVQNKLHPTITGTNGIYTGRDFFGKPFTLFGEAGPTRSRVGAVIEAVSPIYITTAANQFFFTPNSKLLEDFWTSQIQFMGTNTFEPESKSTTVQSKEFFNRIEHQPATDYPKELSEKGRAGDLRLEYLRDRYKTAYGNMVGDLIEANPNMTKSQFQSRVKSAGKRLQKDFIHEYDKDIDKLPKQKSK